MKIPDQIKDAVLKECKLLCPNIGAQHWITDDVLVEMSSPDHWEFRGRGEPYGMCSIGSGAINTQWKVEMAYRLLNLECKEIEGQLKFTIGKLDEETWERQAADRKVMELEERAQGLVDALEESKLALEHARETCQRPKRRYFSTALIKLGEALNRWKGQPAEAQQQ